MNTREIIFSLILCTLAILLWQLVKEEEPVPQNNTQTQDSVPGYYINGAQLTRYNKNGQAEYTITADKIEQDLTSNNLTLSNIKVDYHARGNWVIKADNATLPANRENINFSGNVSASQESENNNASFATDSLIYNIAAQQLHTDDNIRANKGQQVITAKGMTLDMKNERIQLLSRVKIRFNP